MKEHSTILDTIAKNLEVAQPLPFKLATKLKEWRYQMDALTITIEIITNFTVNDISKRSKF